MKTQRLTWMEQAQGLKEFVSESGDFPKQNESPLGRWLHTQRNTGDLSEDRKGWLDENLPGWDRSNQTTWQARADELRGVLPAEAGRLERHCASEWDKG